MEAIMAKIRDVENDLKVEQLHVGRGLGGQEISYALTRLREARLFLADVPAETPFTEKRPG